MSRTFRVIPASKPVQCAVCTFSGLLQVHGFSLISAFSCALIISQNGLWTLNFLCFWHHAGDTKFTYTFSSYQCIPSIHSSPKGIPQPIIPRYTVMLSREKRDTLLTILWNSIISFYYSFSICLANNSIVRSHSATI